MSKIHIRIAKKEDMHAVHKLIVELAVYEKAPNEVSVTPEQLIADGFGDAPLFGCFVAEYETEIIGISLYYWRYSTWKGKRLYLEDLIVTERMRGHGVGHFLFEHTMRHAIEENCSGLMFQVLDWNEPAIQFYKKYNPFFDGEWINVSLSANEMYKLINVQK
ncbi:MAG: GNAT family N-acetyltransferase [Bacteroidia bacterium]